MKKTKETVETGAVQETQKASRRRVIKSALAGTAAVGAASQINSGKWAKPVLDSVVLPGHAETTVSQDTLADSDPCPRPLICSSDALVKRRFHTHDGGAFVLASTGEGSDSGGVVQAVVCPAVAGTEVTLKLNATNISNATEILGHDGHPDYDQTLSAITNASGIAIFSEINLQFDFATETASANLGLVFTAGTAQCSVNLPFTETNYNLDP